MSAGNVWETLEVFIRKNEKVFKLKIFCKSKHGKLENRRSARLGNLMLIT